MSDVILPLSDDGLTILLFHGVIEQQTQRNQGHDVTPTKQGKITGNLRHATEARILQAFGDARKERAALAWRGNSRPRFSRWPMS